MLPNIVAAYLTQNPKREQYFIWEYDSVQTARVWESDTGTVCVNHTHTH